MEELIKIQTNENGIQVVSSKDLYKSLGLAIQHYAKWYEKNIINNDFAIENEDYIEIPQSGRSKDFAIILSFAKKLSMMTRTKEGEIVRNYFLKCEDISKNAVKNIIVPSYQIENPIERAKAWILEKEEVLMLQEKNEKLQYRSDFLDICFDADGVFKFDEVAKILKLGYGSITLYEKMREYGLIMKGTTIPYQKYINNGYFEVYQNLVETGKFNKLVKVTYATSKGIGYIKKLLDNNKQ